YRERPHQFYFHPLPLRMPGEPEAPVAFYLVAFRDSSLERTIVARVFLVSLFGPMLLLVSFIALSIGAIALVPIKRHEHWSVWFWPHGGLVHAYKKISVALGCLLVTCLIVGGVGRTAVVFAALPVLALAVAVILYVLNTSVRCARARLDSKRWH